MTGPGDATLRFPTVDGRSLLGVDLRLPRDLPAERTLVLQYERNQADPQGQLDRTYAFLGLPPHTLSAEDLARPRNASTGQPVVVAPEHLAFLREHYRADVLRLRALVPDLDLSLWPSFADLA